jgi:hypothetical protein
MVQGKMERDVRTAKPSILMPNFEFEREYHGCIA